VSDQEVNIGELEAAALTAVLTDKQIHHIMQSHPDRLFRTHYDIWEFIRNYYELNKSMPPIEMVDDKFRGFEPTENVGATKHHIGELQVAYLRAETLDLITSAAKTVKKEPIEALNEIIQRSSDIKRLTSITRDLDVVDVDDAIAYYEHSAELNRLGLAGIKTGLAGFDNYLPSGIMPGHYGVILAYPQIGKSWLMLYFAIQAWLQGRKPLIMSLEMSEGEVRTRAYTIMGEGRFSHRQISAGELDLVEFKRWSEKYFEGKPAFQIVANDDLGEVTPSTIRAKIDQYQPDIVFVDYIQLMDSDKKADSEPVRIKQISRSVKLMAGSAEVPIILIASATPDDSTDMTGVPEMGQVRWGKDIMFDADFILALGREANSDIITCVFRKNRHGYMGEFYIQADFDSGLFIYKGVDD